MKRADLHLHSNFSDGSDTVFELVEKVQNAGIEIFALTDHDTIAGHFEIEKTDGMKYIRGVELTCKADGISCHILGYNYNPQDLGLSNLIEKGKQLRKIKLEKRIEYLKDVWSIELTEEEKDWLYSRKSVVKTHLANILVKRNLASDNVSAMKKYLDDCKTGNTKFETGEAVQTLLNAGAIPVWAHPLGGEGEEHISKDTFLHQLEIMKTYGIKGLECYYSRYNSEEQSFLVKCAEENKLLISGGSDYHGTNKTVPLGRLNTSDVFVDCSALTLLKELNIG